MDYFIIALSIVLAILLAAGKSINVNININKKIEVPGPVITELPNEDELNPENKDKKPAGFDAVLSNLNAFMTEGSN